MFFQLDSAERITHDIQQHDLGAFQLLGEHQENIYVTDCKLDENEQARLVVVFSSSPEMKLASFVENERQTDSLVRGPSRIVILQKYILCVV
jgi:hypothetical protein